MTQQNAGTVQLANGVRMPWLGLGVWKAKDGEEVTQAVQEAIAAGYRSIDTAAVYGNEAGVGEAIRRSDVPREQLFVTTKVWNTEQGYESTLRAFDDSLNRLGMDYVDLYLVHWPVKGKYKETWRALEQLYREGRTRAIGVSNFHIHHLQDLLADSTVAPAVNQVEYHPLLPQRDLHAFCRDRQIQLEAWSPLMQGNLNHPTLVGLADKYGKTAAQIVLRWNLQQEVVTIPKSVNKFRIIENAKLFDFELSAEDMHAMAMMETGQRFGTDPNSLD